MKKAPQVMTESKRKPYNGDAGYVCSRKCPDGGHVVIYDRQNGGDWIDGDTRWIVAKYSADRCNEGLLEMPTKADAIDQMKGTAAGEEDYTCWYDVAA